MLKELVTSIFCCLPHHQEAPAPVVAERITPITVVSEEPYSQEDCGKAVEERRFEDAFSMVVKHTTELGDPKYIELMDEYCEQFAKERRYLAKTPDDETGEDNPILKGRLALSVCCAFRCYPYTVLVKHALATEDRGYVIKALFWMCVETYKREWEYNKLLNLARGEANG